MSIVNKMLQDLENREGMDTPSADYQPSDSASRTRKLLFVIVAIVLVALGYLTVKYVELPFVDEAKSAVTKLFSGDEEQKGPSNEPKVSVNTALDKIMPAKPMVQQKEPQTVQLEDVLSGEALAAMQNHSGIAPIESTPIEELVEPEPVELLGEKKADAPEAIDTASAEEEKVQEPKTDSSLNIRSTDVSAQEHLLQLESKVQQAIAAKEPLKALVLLQEILQLDPYHHKARKQKAVIAYANNHIDQAILTLEQGMQIAPEEYSYRLMLARLYYKSDQAAYALDLLSAEQPPVAADPEYYAFKGSIAQQLERYDEAGDAYRLLVAFEPHKAKWWLGLAIALDKQGELQTALGAYQQASELKQLPVNVDSFIQQRIKALRH